MFCPMWHNINETKKKSMADTGSDASSRQADRQGQWAYCCHFGCCVVGTYACMYVRGYIVSVLL